MNPYTYERIEHNANQYLRKKHKRWLQYSINFPSASGAHDQKSNIVSGEYFQPRHEGKAPLVILLHGVGDHSVFPCRLLARSLVTKGIACFVLYLVVHSSRMPATFKEHFPLLTSEEWFQSYQTSVIDVRQVIDWACGRKEVDDEKIAVIGISFGGFISAIAMGVDERINAGVFIVAGGNGEKISHKSRLSSIAKGYRRTEAEYRNIQNSYQQYLTEVVEKGFEHVTPVEPGFLTDPMTFAYLLQQRPILMVNARWDEVIPREATLDFWEAAGKPPSVWFPSSHATIWLWYPVIRRRITGFLMSAFETRKRRRLS